MDQLRAIDNRRRIRSPLLRLPSITMKHVGQSLLELLGVSF
jgi:mRNA-degrading endonuclease toxin of MazEF toxin-antitoxin module